MKAKKEDSVDKKTATPDPGNDKGTTSSQLSEFATGTLNLISSVRFGVVMLSLLLFCCLIGMFIMQQNMDGFPEYYQSLKPSQQIVYGSLGFFNIYNTWYFTMLLALTGLSIILSSINSFPRAWQFLRRPELIASRDFITTQGFHAEAESGDTPETRAEQIANSWRGLGFESSVTKQDDKIILFAQRNVWNRFGAQATHLALILIFLGGFLTSRYSEGGMIEIIPGRSSNEFVSFQARLDGNEIKRMRLPFTVECTDLKQELIKPEGGLEPMNTVDWLSYITIKDTGNVHSGLVHLNEPLDYRGYRFFQSSFEPQGYAREITLSLDPMDGSAVRDIKIGRNQTVKVENIGEISYNQFYPDFTLQQQKPQSLSGNYNNPAVRLQVKSPDGKTQPTLAFNPKLASEFYGKVSKEELGHLLIAGNKAILKGFEKVAISHTLTVQYDPGREPVYAGFILMLISLFGVFLFSHQRVWAFITPASEGSRIYFGGDTNRHKAAFESRFNSLVDAATGQERDKNE